MISVLITTYNRPELVKRAIESVLKQTYKQIELIIIDDASDKPIDLPLDDRIRYYRNTENQGAKHGDRAHLRRFVNELAKGEYFVYLCDDDFWIPNDLLERQMMIMENLPNTAMVIGGQLSNFGDEQKFHKNVFPQKFMSSKEYLEHFCKKPIECNIIVGATLYNKSKFLESGALSEEQGSKWQAGYELLIAPALYGDVVYFDEPCIETSISPGNASFNRTQAEHYMDSIVSLKAAFRKPSSNFSASERYYLEEAFNGISRAFLANAEHIRRYGSLTMCSAENISKPVTQEMVEEARGYLYA